MASFTDLFNRADSNTTLGSPWTVPTAGATWGIASNAAYLPSGTSGAIAIQPGSVDGEATITCKQCDAAVGVVMRCADDNNYYLAQMQFGTNNVQLYKRVAGSFTQLGATTSAGTVSETSLLKLKCIGSAIQVYLDGNLVTAFGTAGTVTDGSLTSATGIGIRMSSSDERIDSISFTAASSAPTLASPVVPSGGVTLTATLSASGCIPTSGAGGFTLSGTSATVASWAISGTTLTLTLSGTVLSSDTVTYSYSRAATTDDISDSGGTNFLADFSGAAVTNNSTQTTSLTAGTASFVSSGPAVINVSSTAATGGTSPYTYQWQRNVDGGSYSNLSGKTSLSCSDTTATAGHSYRYKCVQTDNVSAVVTTNATPSAQVYSGGLIGGSSGSVFASPLIRGVG